MVNIKLNIDCNKTTCGRCKYLRNHNLSKPESYCELWPQFEFEASSPRFLICNKKGFPKRKMECLNAEQELNEERDR